MASDQVATQQFDISRKYVRVMDIRGSGMIEFEFSVGEPEMAVELIMPEAAFAEFCQHNQVTFLGDPPESDVDAAADRDSADSAWSWSLRTATQQRFR
jgi:phenol hydroxylase P0 protein